MLEALSAAVSAAFLIGGGLVAYHELRAIACSRYIEIANQLFDEMNSPDIIAARRWVFLHVKDCPEKRIAELTDTGRESIKKVLNSLDRAAFLTQDGWIPDHLIMPWLSIMVVKSWTKLEGLVGYERSRRHQPDYYALAEGLFARCKSWREEHVPDSEITWLEDAL